MNATGNFSYHIENEQEFLEVIGNDLLAFRDANPVKRVLIFPPLDKHRRFLIHKQAKSLNVKTASISEGLLRFVIAYVPHLCNLDSTVKSETTPKDTVMDDEQKSARSRRARSKPGMALYVPPAIRNQNKTANSQPRTNETRKKSSTKKSIPVETVRLGVESGNPKVCTVGPPSKVPNTGPERIDVPVSVISTATVSGGTQNINETNEAGNIKEENMEAHNIEAKHIEAKHIEADAIEADKLGADMIHAASSNDHSKMVNGLEEKESIEADTSEVSMIVNILSGDTTEMVNRLKESDSIEIDKIVDIPPEDNNDMVNIVQEAESIEPEVISLLEEIIVDVTTNKHVSPDPTGNVENTFESQNATSMLLQEVRATVSELVLFYTNNIEVSSDDTSNAYAPVALPEDNPFIQETVSELVRLYSDNIEASSDDTTNAYASVALPEDNSLIQETVSELVRLDSDNIAALSDDTSNAYTPVTLPEDNVLIQETVSKLVRLDSDYIEASSDGASNAYAPVELPEDNPLIQETISEMVRLDSDNIEASSDGASNAYAPVELPEDNALIQETVSELVCLDSDNIEVSSDDTSNAYAPVALSEDNALIEDIVNQIVDDAVKDQKIIYEEDQVLKSTIGDASNAYALVALPEDNALIQESISELVCLDANNIGPASDDTSNAYAAVELPEDKAFIQETVSELVRLDSDNIEASSDDTSNAYAPVELPEDNALIQETVSELVRLDSDNIGPSSDDTCNAYASVALSGDNALIQDIVNQIVDDAVKDKKIIYEDDHQVIKSSIGASQHEIITQELADKDKDILKVSDEINSRTKRIIKPTSAPSDILIISNKSDSESEIDCWEDLFDDSGEIDSSIMEEITQKVGEVTLTKATGDYTDYLQRTSLHNDMGHVLEAYDFPSQFETRDLVTILDSVKCGPYNIKWVDDNHALGVFSSTFAASQILSLNHPLLKLRPLSDASKQSKLKAKKYPNAMAPVVERPQTCPQTARRLVTGALGVKLTNAREERQKEIKILKEAREKKKISIQQELDAWEGKPKK